MKPTILAAMLAAGVAAAPAVAQDFPTGTITILQGFAPGGSADTISRIVADPLSERLGVPVVVEARPGAGGTLASAAIAQAAPDGHTIGLITGGHAVSKALYNSLPFDVVEDFTPLTTVVEYNFVLAVPADSEAQTLGDLLDQARAAPGDVAYGSAGVGTTHHLTGALLGSMAGVELDHIAYRGEGAAITGLLGGEIPLIIASPVTLKPQIDAGSIRALAVTSDQRWSGLPDVPTVAEAGVEGFDVSTWAALVAPAGLPDDVADTLRTEILAVLEIPEVQAQLESAVGGVVAPSAPEDLAERIGTEAARWEQVVAEAGIERQ